MRTHRQRSYDIHALAEKAPNLYTHAHLPSRLEHAVLYHPSEYRRRCGYRGQKVERMLGGGGTRRELRNTKPPATPSDDDDMTPARGKTIHSVKGDAGPPRSMMGSGRREEERRNTMESRTAFPDTQYGHQTTQTRLQSETADQIICQRCSAPTSDTESFDSTTNDALSCIEWQDVRSANPLRSAVEIAKGLEPSTVERRSRLLIIAGRSRRLAAENHLWE
ncbi:hypothetical protein BC629DRAFT_1586398 [Irpex lacteus]|nr:hypothetical protein BC629DRAFT_1586398 [Irpex lacteus]